MQGSSDFFRILRVYSMIGIDFAGSIVYCLTKIFNKMNDEIEIWRDVAGYEGLYKVSNLGNVMSLRHKKIFILKPRKDGWGYLFVTLINHNKYKNFKIHRLVAEAFLPNLNNLPQVNHKDECKTNNRVSNLEWCTPQYNTNYGTANDRRTKMLTNRNDLSKPVLQYDKNGNFIKEYSSIMYAERKTGIYHQNIGKVCRGKYHTAGGFLWKYKDN